MAGNIFLIPQKFTDAAKKATLDGKERANAAKALNAQSYAPKKKKNLFSSALKEATGLKEYIPDPLKDAGSAALSGMETWGNQVQSVPATLFTKGIVQDGQYTTERNLIGNPFQNAASHIKAQRETGLITGKPDGFLDTVGEGFKAANRAGRAYSEDPDIAAGTKFGTGVVFDPSSFLGAGVLSKAAGLAGKTGIAPKAARGALGLAEGFERPSQVAKFALGGAAGTQLAANYDLPGVSEGVEQFAGGMLGGIGGAAIGARGIGQSLKDVNTAGEKLQGRQGRGMAVGLMTEPVEPEKRIYHNTPSVFEGEIKISPDGDIGPGHYVTLAPGQDYLQGDSDGMKQGFWRDRYDQIPQRDHQGATNKYRPTKVLQLLVAEKRLEPNEIFRLEQVMPPELKGKINDYQTALQNYRHIEAEVGPEIAIDLFSSAGWDGFKQEPGEYSSNQIAIWKPNESLISDWSKGFGEDKKLDALAADLDYTHGPVKKMPTSTTGTTLTYPEAKAQIDIAINTPGMGQYSIDAKNLQKNYDQGILTTQEYIDKWDAIKKSGGGQPASTYSAANLSPAQVSEYNYFHNAYPNFPEDALAEYISKSYRPNGDFISGSEYVDQWAGKNNYSLDSYKHATPAANPSAVKYPESSNTGKKYKWDQTTQELDIEGQGYHYIDFPAHGGYGAYDLKGNFQQALTIPSLVDKLTAKPKNAPPAPTATLGTLSEDDRSYLGPIWTDPELKRKGTSEVITYNPDTKVWEWKQHGDNSGSVTEDASLAKLVQHAQKQTGWNTVWVDEDSYKNAQTAPPSGTMSFTPYENPQTPEEKLLNAIFGKDADRATQEPLTWNQALDIYDSWPTAKKNAYNKWAGSQSPVPIFEESIPDFEKHYQGGPVGSKSTIPSSPKDQTIADYTKIGEQLGSNPGGKYKDASGNEYYIKQYSDVDQAHTEIASQKVYEALGIKVPKSKVIGDGSLVTPWEKVQPFLTAKDLRDELTADPEQAARLYAAAMITENWDHVGLEFDNMVRGADGKLTVIDHGGSFTYRAQGKKKAYTTDAAEWKSFADSSIASQTQGVFKDVIRNPVFLKTLKKVIGDIVPSSDTFKNIPGVDWHDVNAKASALYDAIPEPKNTGQITKGFGSVGSQLRKSGMKPVQSEPIVHTPKHYSGLKDFEEIKTYNAGMAKMDFDKLSKMQQAKYTQLKADKPDAPHSWLMKQAKALPTNNGPISGGAAPEQLVAPREVTVGLTGTEKAGNVVTKVKQFLLGHGVKNDATATPMAREYLRINNVLKNQANQFGKIAHRAERILDIDPETLEVNLKNLTPEQQKMADQLLFHKEAWDETLNQFDAKFEDIQEFATKIRAEAGSENKAFSDILQEYANAIANKVSDKWLGGQIANLGENLDIVQKAGGKIPTKTVNLPGASDVKLPPQIAEVLQRAVKQVHPTKQSEAGELFSAINNTLRGLWASMDGSFVGIQQLPTWADNPALASKVTHGSMKVLKDPTAFAKWVEDHDAARFGSKPTTTDYVRNGLHIAQATGEGTDMGGIAGAVQRIPVYGKFQKLTNRLFTESGNFNRVMLADNLWDRMEDGIPILHGIDPKTMTREEKLAAISRAANRSTGYSEKAFGGAYGASIFFAPRFMQSQLEMTIKAISDGSIEGQVARRQLIKLIAMGAALTVTINEFNGEETDFDPRSSNFMRMKNIGGADLSLFGPWDTLVKGVVRSVPHVGSDGDFTLGDPQYLLRSKLSPVLSTTVDFISGENVVGQPVGFGNGTKQDLLQVRNLLAPFAIRKVGEEPLSSTAFGFVGGKGTPLSDKEVLDSRLSSAGIKRSDPDYLIKRREWMANNQDQIPAADKPEFKRTQEVKTDISKRRLANDNLTTSNGQSLADFRENRKLLLTEQRTRLSEVIKSEGKMKGPNAKYLNSYFKLFEDKSALDPITGEIDSDKFDISVAKWTNENGAEALDFVQRYLGAGLNPAEKAYYTDMQTLEKAGYFDRPKYQKMKSDLTEDEIDSLSRAVDAARAGNPKLQQRTWAQTAKQILGPGLDSDELMDVIHSRLDAYQSKELTKLKEQYGKELLWFNSRANWSSYEGYKPGKKSSGSASSKLGVSLKPATLKMKPSLK